MKGADSGWWVYRFVYKCVWESRLFSFHLVQWALTSVEGKRFRCIDSKAKGLRLSHCGINCSDTRKKVILQVRLKGWFPCCRNKHVVPVILSEGCQYILSSWAVTGDHCLEKDLEFRKLLKLYLTDQFLTCNFEVCGVISQGVEEFLHQEVYV